MLSPCRWSGHSRSLAGRGDVFRRPSGIRSPGRFGATWGILPRLSPSGAKDRCGTAPTPGIGAGLATRIALLCERCMYSLRRAQWWQCILTSPSPSTPMYRLKEHDMTQAHHAIRAHLSLVSAPVPLGSPLSHRVSYCQVGGGFLLHKFS